MTTRIAYATTTAVLAHGGQRVSVRAGDPWDADDPLVSAYPDMFTEALPAVRCTTDPSGMRPVETATAAPGEQRQAARRPRTSGGKK